MSEWEERRTAETKRAERALGQHFPTVQVYRQNSASIRVRVIDEQFESKSREEREALAMPHIMALPKRTREDITMIILLAPSELNAPGVHMLTNRDFEHPLPSNL